MKNLYRSAFLVFLIPALSASCDSDDPEPIGSGGSSNTGGTEDTGETESATGGNGGTDPNVCADLDQDDCEANEVCRPAFGYKAQPEAQWPVLDFSTKSYQGCRYSGPLENEILCGDSMPCGHDPDEPEECWGFNNNCLPIGWEYVQCDNPCMNAGEGGAGGGSNAR